MAAEEPGSTFSVDVDTASYANVRRMLEDGHLPPQDAVRVEELINYFSYNYPVPDSSAEPFASSLEVARTPWNPHTYLLQIGIQGYELERVGERPNANLVFLIDVSGSMDAPDKLGLVVDSLEMLTKELGEDDSVADGDFNVGMTDIDALEELIERKRETGITFTALAFGTGNVNDALMERLSNAGNGNYGYIDSLMEARKVLVDEMDADAFHHRQGVKGQIEFNPGLVAEYRLIGYENRILDREDFNNDKVDAGDIGAGHSVTLLYEIALVGGQGLASDPLRYGANNGDAPILPDPDADEIAFLKLRYKAPEGDESRLIAQPIDRMLIEEAGEREPSESLRFAAAVAAFGQLLSGAEHIGDFSFDDVLALAQAARGDDPYGYRAEFVQLVRLADSLSETIN